MQELKKATKDYSLEAVKSAIAQSTLNKEQIVAVLTQQGLQGEILETTADELSNVVSTNAVAKAQKGATASTLSLSNAFKGLWAVMKAHPIISIAVGLTAVVGAIVGINKAIEKHNKELRESSTELTNAYKQEKSELQSLVDKYSELNEKLTSASLTTEEYESIKSELTNIQDTLVTKYGEEARNTVDDINSEFESTASTVDEVAERYARLAQGVKNQDVTK